MNLDVLGEKERICRVCLARDVETNSIFGLERYLEQNFKISEVIMNCASVQIYKGDGLPEQICTKCVQELLKAFGFFRRCERSDATLRGCLLTTITVPINPESYYENSREDSLETLNDCDDSASPDKNTTTDDAEVLDKNDETLKKITRKSYNCEKCDTVCYGLYDYRRHITNVHGDAFECNICTKKFSTNSMLKRHKTTHKSSEKPAVIKKRNAPRTCSICNKTFRFHSNLERHKLTHTGEKPFLCNVCGKGFAQLSYLKIHSFIHTGEKPYKCETCDKSFAAPGTLMTHVRTHTGEKPHVCRICGKDFTQSGYLAAHIRTHTGEKPMECKVCHRRFNQSGRLIVHMRIHSGEKPYACKDCGRCFAVKGTLKKHIRTHTGERPYVCSVCGQAFAQNGTLTTHMMVHKPK